MKRALALLVLSLALLSTPFLVKRSGPPTAGAVSATDAGAPSEFRFPIPTLPDGPMCDGQDKPKAPKLERPKLAKGEKWVQLIRFAGGQEVASENIDPVADQIKQANDAGVDVIVLELNTPGGYVDVGQEFERVIEQSKAPVQCVVDGMAASMGYQILQSCTTRMATKRSAFLIHEPASGGLVQGHLTVWKNMSLRLEVLAAAELEQTVHRMKVSKDYVHKKIEHDQDWWFNWGEALDVGAVDGVVASVEDVVRSYKASRPPTFLK